MNSNSLSNIYSKTRIKNYPSPFKKKGSLQDPKTNDSRVKKRVKRIISTRVLPSLSNNFTIMLGESSCLSPSLPVSPRLFSTLSIHRHVFSDFLCAHAHAYILRHSISRLAYGVATKWTGTSLEWGTQWPRSARRRPAGSNRNRWTRRDYTKR